MVSEEIKEQFREVIRYSQGIENPQVDELFETFCKKKYFFYHAFQCFRHNVEAEVVRVAAVYGAFVAVEGGKMHFAIYEIDVFVAFGACARVACGDDIAARGCVIAYFVVVRRRHHYNRKLGVRFAHGAVARVVRALQVLCVGRVVVVIVYENAHVKPCDILHHGFFALCAARKAEVYIVAVEPAGNSAGVIAARGARAAALRYGRTVENYRLFARVAAAPFRKARTI